MTAAAQFGVRIACDNGFDNTFTIGVGGTGSSPDLPVGTSCTVTETAPAGGLVDSSYAWGAVTIPDQPVQIVSSGQVIPVTVTNDVIRVRGSLTISKAPIAGGTVVDPARSYAIEYRCVYAADPAVEGSVLLVAGASTTIPDLLLGAACTVTENPATLADPPVPGDPSWVWLPPTYDPGQNVVVTSATTPITVGVTNRIQQLTGGFNLTKVVQGAGKEGGYSAGTTFQFDITCGNGFSETVNLADTAGFQAGTIPVGTECTIEEVDQPPTDPAFAWEPVVFTGHRSDAGREHRDVRGHRHGYPDQRRQHHHAALRLGCRREADRRRHQWFRWQHHLRGHAELRAGPNLPTGSSWRRQRHPGRHSGRFRLHGNGSGAERRSGRCLVCLGCTTYDPVGGAVTVEEGTPQTVVIANEIVRVYAPVRLVKSYTGPQGVLDPARTFPVTWSCVYDGPEPVSVGGTVDVPVDPAGVLLADEIPVTAACSATEGTLSPPNADPAFRWLVPVITGTTVTVAGPNIVTVANSLTRDDGIVRVLKVVTGETDGYVNRGTGDEDFTLHGQCSVPGQPQIPTRYADGSIADGGSRDIVASVGWTCSGYEDTPGQDLLKDDSYAWGTPILTGTPPLAADGTFVLPTDDAVQIFRAENPIVRVRSAFTITKDIIDPNGIVLPSAVFTGTYRCIYGEGEADEEIEQGDWSITPAVLPTFQVQDVLIGSVCSVTENDPGTTGLPDASWAWAPSLIEDADTVVVGATASVAVTNTAIRLYGGLQVIKTVVDPDGGVLPGATFSGAWQCQQGRDTYAGRFVAPVNGATVLFTPASEEVPATATCSITEDTLNGAGLRDGSFAWGEPTYSPASVVLVPGQTADLGMTNTVVRVYSDVTVTKDVTGPADGLVPTDRAFTGTVSCQYGTDAPVETTWSATIATPALRAGVLVGSVCTAVEDPPGAGGQPVTGDPSYIWLSPTVSGPITVTPPETVTPPIEVTNPTERLFGTFRVTKSISGAVEGIVDPRGPYLMSYSCQPGSGPAISGDIEVVLGVVREVGPAQEIPVNSTCVLTEPLDTMPPLRDKSWNWDAPAFTEDGIPAPGVDRSLTFVIPSVQEDFPEPVIAIGVRNNVTKTDGAWSVSKTSDPPSGTVVSPGTTITYTLALDSTGSVPVHDVVVTDDLTAVLPFATVVDGSITAPDGTSASVDVDARTLTWTVGTVPENTSLALTFQVTVNPGAAGISIGNVITGSGDVPPTACAAPVADLAVVADAANPCATDSPTTLAPTISKESTGPAIWDPAAGTWTVGYRITAVNPNPANEVPYTLTDSLGFPAGTEIVSAAVTLVPSGVTPSTPAWDGVDAVTVAEDVILPPQTTHTYELSVTVAVPAGTPAATLTCAAGDGVSGSGLFNQVTVDSLGSQLTRPPASRFPPC